MENKPKVNSILNLTIKTYKIPVKVEEDKITELTSMLDNSMLVKEESITIDRSIENLTLKIKEYSQRVGNHNKLQEKITIANSRDYINKQILTRNK